MTLDVYIQQQKQNKTKQQQQIQKRQGSGTRITTFSDLRLSLGRPANP